MNVNYDRVCRLCLSSRGELLPIFPTTSSDVSEPPVLASKINDCVSVQINENDDLPTNVCRKCMDNVNNWHIFKTVCEKTQNKLQSLIKKDGSLLEEVNVKSEPLSDEAYDDGVVIDGSYPIIEDVSSANKLQPEGPPILASLGLTPRSEKTYVDPRMDWHRVHAILDMIQENDIIDSLQSTEESDVLHHSDHDSESETELLANVEDIYITRDHGYLCRNKSVLSKNPRKSEIIEETNKPRKRKATAVKHCPRPKNAWQLLFTDDLLELIVASTNESISKQSKATTTYNEIRTLIGILYMQGIMRPTHGNYAELWDSNTGITCINNAMTIDRFRFLLQNLRFDCENDDSLIQFDVMKRIRKVFEIFAMNCRTVFEVDSIAVVDEIIVPVYGPCPFRYDIDKKSLKCGIKIVLLVDPTNFYISNLDVITDPYFSAEEIVKKLNRHLLGTGRTIVMDSWYFTKPLMSALKNYYDLYTVAALNPHDEIIPPLFLSHYRKCRTFMTGFLNEQVSLTSYVTSEAKSINILSNEPKFYKKGPNINHLNAVSMYKKNQSVVEVLDVLMNYYTTMQHTNDWTLSLFFTLLNIASVNAQVIWSSRNTNVTKRRIFIRDLATGLMENDDFLVAPLAVNKRSVPLVLNETSYQNRGRCRICRSTTKRDRKTRLYCLKCGQFICREHSVAVCTMCANN